MGKFSAILWMVFGAAIMWLYLDAYPKFRSHQQTAAESQDSGSTRESSAAPDVAVRATTPQTSSPYPPIIQPALPSYTSKTEEEFPATGSTISYTTQAGQQTASFTVINDKEGKNNCVVKLEDWGTQAPVVELFIRAREQGTTRAVPLGEYRVKVACGQRWYGRANMFGHDTKITVGAESIKFWKDENSTIGHTLNLTEKFDGNLKMIDPIAGRF